MTFFNARFIEFLRELEKNNNTLWFNENRKTYEKEVKQPFNAFVDEMILRIKVYEPAIPIKAADAIMRINKDIRFSKDKTPYKTHMAANISHYGKKDKAWPGFYFQISHQGITIYGGTYMPEPPALLKIRSHITANPDAFAKIYSDKDFQEKFGSIQGEKNKKLPDEFKAAAIKEPLIANKQFYYMAELEPKIALTEKLPEVLMSYYQAGKGLNDFLKEAMGG
jgi:uncharacterized protein (TIGR02453 family)